MTQVRFSKAEHSRTQRRIEELGPWFQNIRLPIGLETAPEHPLGDWPGDLARMFLDEIPHDLSGKTVLDIGCNAGYFSFLLASRGAEVVGVDPNPRYLAQARWLRKKFNMHSQVRFRQSHVYDLAHYHKEFDIVLFLSYMHHLRYPLLGLDVAAEKAREMFIVQTLMTPPSQGRERPDQGKVRRLEDLSALAGPPWPQVTFVEGELFGDPSNWWVPSPEAMQALLRSAGLHIRRRRGGQVYICEPRPEDSAVRHWDRSEYLAATGRTWRSESLERFEPKQGTLEMVEARR